MEKWSGAYSRVFIRTYPGNRICSDSFQELYWLSGSGKKVLKCRYMNGWRKERARVRVILRTGLKVRVTERGKGGISCWLLAISYWLLVIGLLANLVRLFHRGCNGSFGNHSKLQGMGEADAMS